MTEKIQGVRSSEDVGDSTEKKVFRWGDELVEEGDEKVDEGDEESFGSVAELLDEELSGEIRRLEEYFRNKN